MRETKKCPACAEEIQREARKCRYCGEWFASSFEDLRPVAPATQSEEKGYEPFATDEAAAAGPEEKASREHWLDFARRYRSSSRKQRRPLWHALDEAQREAFLEAWESLGLDRATASPEFGAKTRPLDVIKAIPGLILVVAGLGSLLPGAGSPSLRLTMGALLVSLGFVCIGPCWRLVSRPFPARMARVVRAALGIALFVGFGWGAQIDNADARADGWADAAERNAAAREGIDDPARYRELAAAAGREHREDARVSVSKHQAWRMAKQFLEERLDSPRTETYGSLTTFDYQSANDVVTDLGNGEFHVRAWVESQNAFGAMVRTHFEMDLRHLGDRQWRMSNFRTR